MISKLKAFSTEFLNTLSPDKEIAVVIHLNPDGDAIGGALGLFNFFKDKYKISVIAPNDFAQFLKWLPGADKIQNFAIQEEAVIQTLNKAEIIFCIDFNGADRVGEKMKNVLLNASGKKFMIDHHPQPEDFCKHILSSTKVSSAAEMVYLFIKNIKKHGNFDKTVAKCLYAGIMTDTGGFNYNAPPCTFGNVKELLEFGINKEAITDAIYNNYSYNRMQLLGHILNNNLYWISEVNTAYIVLSQEVMKKYNFNIGDAEGFVNYPLSIKNVIFSVLFTEKEDHVKLSLRSKGVFDVNQFARKHYKGGGHLNAAGGKSQKSLQETINHFNDLLNEYKKDLNTTASILKQQLKS